jgi:hypothetical protein
MSGSSAPMSTSWWWRWPRSWRGSHGRCCTAGPTTTSVLRAPELRTRPSRIALGLKDSQVVTEMA